MGKSLVEMAAEIINSQCTSTAMSADEITESLQKTYNTLLSLQENELLGSGQPVEGNIDEVVNLPELSPAKSILKNKIICLECGESYKMLSPKHLKSHGLTAREYRKKHGFSLRQPLCAKSLSEARKKAGKERGVPPNLLKAIAARKKKNAKK